MYHLHFHSYLAYETKHIKILSLGTILIVERLEYRISPCGDDTKIFTFDTASVTCFIANVLRTVLKVYLAWLSILELVR